MKLICLTGLCIVGIALYVLRDDIKDMFSSVQEVQKAAEEKSNY